MAFNRFSARSATKSTETKPQVLVIDDDFSIRRALEFTLQKKYQVVLCEDGEKGLTHVNPQTQTVVLDIKMPGKNGLEVYEEIKKLYPNLPIIFYSAFQNILESATLRRQYKPYAYFDKNGDSVELIAAIDKAVTHFQSISRINETTSRLKSMREQN